MIHLDDGGPVWTVLLNRPDKANSLTEAMLSELCQIVTRAADADMRALILTGAGRVFSAGADLEQAKAGLATSPLWEVLSAKIAALPCLTIAALNGTLAGGAFGMALACDIRIAVPEANFFYPVMKLGFLPQPSDPTRLSALIGPARAKMILMTGARISAQDALDWGLIERIVPATDLLTHARSLTDAAASASAAHVAGIKALMP